jgi:hypothetical protein
MGLAATMLPRTTWADRPPVVVEVTCPDLDAAELRDVLGLETGRAVSAPPSLSGPHATIAVVCADGKAVVRVEEPTSPAPRTRTLGLSDTPTIAQPRLIALALAELLTPEPAPAPPAAPPPAAPPPVIAAPAPAVAGTARVVALAAAGGTAGAGLALGGGLRVGGAFGDRPLGWHVDITFQRGRAAVPLGAVVTDSVTLAAPLSLRLNRQRWIGSVGAGAGARLVRLSGRPEDDAMTARGVVTAVTGGPQLHAGVQRRLGARTTVELSLDAGYLLRPIVGYAGAARAVSMAGPWAAGAVGVGFGF